MCRKAVNQSINQSNLLSGVRNGWSLSTVAGIVAVAELFSPVSSPEVVNEDSAISTAKDSYSPLPILTDITYSPPPTCASANDDPSSSAVSKGFRLSVTTILGTNCLNSADVALTNKPTNKQVIQRYLKP